MHAKASFWKVSVASVRNSCPKVATAWRRQRSAHGRQSATSSRENVRDSRPTSPTRRSCVGRARVAPASAKPHAMRRVAAFANKQMATRANLRAESDRWIGEWVEANGGDEARIPKGNLAVNAADWTLAPESWPNEGAAAVAGAGAAGSAPSSLSAAKRSHLAYVVESDAIAPRTDLVLV